MLLGKKLILNLKNCVRLEKAGLGSLVGLEKRFSLIIRLSFLVPNRNDGAAVSFKRVVTGHIHWVGSM